MVDTQTLSIIFAGLSIAASIVYYASVLRNANIQREKEYLQQRISIIDPDFYNNWRRLGGFQWSTYDEWLDIRDENPEIYGHFTYITMVLNGVGLLLQKKAIDPDLLFSLYTPNMIIWTWEIAQPVIEVWREAINYPEQYGPLRARARFKFHRQYT
jgi:hypothetical protein